MVNAETPEMAAQDSRAVVGRGHLDYHNSNWDYVVAAEGTVGDVAASIGFEQVAGGVAVVAAAKVSLTYSVQDDLVEPLQEEQRKDAY